MLAAQIELKQTLDIAMKIFFLFPILSYSVERAQKIRRYILLASPLNLSDNVKSFRILSRN